MSCKPIKFKWKMNIHLLSDFQLKYRPMTVALPDLSLFNARFTFSMDDINFSCCIISLLRMLFMISIFTIEGLSESSAKCSLRLFIIQGGYLIISLPSFHFKWRYDDGAPKSAVINKKSSYTFLVAVHLRQISIPNVF